MSLISGAGPYSWVGANAAPTSNWIGDTMTAIQLSQNQAGLLGTLQDMASGTLGDISSSANSFATIAQTSTTNAGAFYAQLASQAIKKRQSEALQKSLEDLQRTQNNVTAQNVLDPIVFLPGGAIIDTNNNIMTMPDGTKYDTVTGARYVDPASVIQLANGAYLDTQNNILTMPDGTRIDTVTGLTISTTA